MGCALPLSPHMSCLRGSSLLPLSLLTGSSAGRFPVLAFSLTRNSVFFSLWGSAPPWFLPSSEASFLHVVPPFPLNMNFQCFWANPSTLNSFEIISLVLSFFLSVELVLLELVFPCLCMECHSFKFASTPPPLPRTRVLLPVKRTDLSFEIWQFSVFWNPDDHQCFFPFSSPIPSR